MRIFYTPDIQGSPYTMSPQESKHCVQVLRLTNGDEVILVDGKGNKYEGVISEASPKKCVVTIVETTPEWELWITLFILQLLQPKILTALSGCWRSVPRWA